MAHAPDPASIRSRTALSWVERRSVDSRLGMLSHVAIAVGLAMLATSVGGGLYIRNLAEVDEEIAHRALTAALLEKDFASLERDVFRHGMVRDAPTQEDYRGNVADFQDSLSQTACLMANGDSAVQAIKQTSDAYVQTTVDVFSAGQDGPAAATRIMGVGDQVDASIEKVRDREIAAAAAIDQQQNLLLTWVMGLSVAITLAASAIYFLFTRAIRRTINSELSGLSQAIAQIESGQLDVAVPHLDRDDEIGGLARAAERLRDANRSKLLAAQETQAMLDIMGTHLRAMADGDLSADMPDLGENYAGLRADFGAMVVRLRESLASVSEAAESVRLGASEINQATSDLARRTEVNAAEISDVTETIRAITGDLKNSSSRAHTAADDVSAAVTEARTGGEIVGRAVDAMAAIESSTVEIGKIISVIDEIAFQTNLLALNAGVEAARAGDVGRGFAVVASEVRALAQRSADAAKDIRQLIHGSAAEVEQGVLLVRQTGDALSSIIAQVTSVTDVVLEISAASTRQSGELERANEAMSSMEMSSQQNAAMVEEGTAAARGLANQSDVLTDVVSRFRIRRGTGAGPAAKVAQLPVTRAVRRVVGHSAVKASALAIANEPNGEDWSEF